MTVIAIMLLVALFVGVAALALAGWDMHTRFERNEKLSPHASTLPRTN